MTINNLIHQPGFDDRTESERDSRVSVLNLAPNGIWLDSKTIELYVYDAGTDDGANYTLSNLDADPKQPVSRIEVSPFNVDNSVKTIGALTFIKQ